MGQHYHPNSYKYLIAPTWEQIESVVNKSGASLIRFERYHGIWKGCLGQVKIGVKRLPIKYWHIFLDKNHTAPSITPKKPPYTVRKRIRAATPSKATNLLMA